MIIIFREVVKYDEFLSLSLEEMIELISCNDLTVPFEENVSKQKLLIVMFYFIWVEDGSICLHINNIICRRSFIIYTI